MRKLLRLVLWISVAGGVGLVAAWLPDALAEIEYFRATEFRVVGARLIETQEILETAAIPWYASVFDATDSWEGRLERHPLVRRARITKDLPRTLVLTVEEREPVALVAGALLDPVDRDGQVLPLSPAAYRMDLPLLRADRGFEDLSASQLRILAMEVERLTADDPSFMSSVSEIALDDKGDATAVVEGDVRLRFRPPLSHRRLRDGLTALDDAGRRRPDQQAAIVDLRYADQVVVSYQGRSGQ
jgi:cell division protein FtsQ